MTDIEILEIEDRLTARVDALQALLKTEKQRAALSSLWESMVEWRDAYLELLGEQAEEEASVKEAAEEDTFRFLHRQLAGFAEKFTAFSRGRQECVCKAFKAQQVNAVLRPLQALMEADMGVPLPLVSEEEQHTYSDVSLLLCTYLGVGASYARKHFCLDFDASGREVQKEGYGYGRRT